MKPLQHAKISAHKHGGKWEDYIDIHEFFDQTKAHCADMRHRAILHNSMGIFLATQVFGAVRTNSAGREYSVRDIGEDHVLEDYRGKIPSMSEIINLIPKEALSWLGGMPKIRVIKFDDLDEETKNSVKENSDDASEDESDLIVD